MQARTLQTCSSQKWFQMFFNYLLVGFKDVIHMIRLYTYIYTYVYTYICIYVHVYYIHILHIYIYLYVIVTHKASDCRTITVAELVFQSANCMQQVVQQSCKNLPGLLGLVGSNLLASNTLKLCTHSNNCCEKKQGPS